MAPPIGTLRLEVKGIWILNKWPQAKPDRAKWQLVKHMWNREKEREVSKDCSKN